MAYCIRRKHSELCYHREEIEATDDDAKLNQRPNATLDSSEGSKSTLIWASSWEEKRRENKIIESRSDGALDFSYSPYSLSEDK